MAKTKPRAQRTTKSRIHKGKVQKTNVSAGKSSGQAHERYMTGGGKP